MTRWNIYVGGYTKEFEAELARMKGGTNRWEREWLNPSTASTGWKAEGSIAAAPRTPTATMPYADGIDCYRFDDVKGVFSHLGTVTEDIVCPQYLAVHPSLPVLYASQWKRPSELTAFAIRPDGTLERRSTTNTLGDLAIAVDVHPTGNVAYVAHWGDGNITACRLADDGSVLDAELVVRGHAEPESPQFSRLHQVSVTPSGRGLLVTDVGRDEVVSYSVTAEGTMSPDPAARIAFPERYGPRHVAFHPSGNFVYVSDERGSMIHLLEAKDGMPTVLVASYPTAPPAFEGNNKPSELRIHPSGRTLYVGNRGANTVTIFAIDTATGKLDAVDHHPSGGTGNSTVRLDPQGKLLLAGNYKGGLVAFDIDENGRLHSTGVAAEVKAPRFVLMVEA